MLAVQSEGQEIDGQPSRPIDLIKSGHLSRSSIGVNDGPSFEGPALASADRLAGGFRLRHPYLCQAPIDKQTTAPIDRVRAPSGPRFVIPPASPCSGSASKSGIGDFNETSRPHLSHLNSHALRIRSA
jgi:hypothetical protein